MASLSFFATDIDGNTVEIDRVISYELSKDMNAACDGIRLSFLVDNPLGELCSLQVYKGDKHIFNGYVDTQRESVDINGLTCFLYARSSACILVDNEAMPYVYNSPSVQSLCFTNALPFGFSWDLPNIFCNQEYQVAKGISCFGAINDFTMGICGKRIAIDPDNCISLLESGHNVTIFDNDVLSEKRVINRGEVVTRLDYKTDASNGFDHHFKSRYFEKKGIATSKKCNVSTLPLWQKEYSLQGMLRSAGLDYLNFELVFDGVYDISLCDQIFYCSKVFGSVDDLIVTSICYSLNKNGETTRICLAKNIDLEEISYVD